MQCPGCAIPIRARGRHDAATESIPLVRLVRVRFHEVATIAPLDTFTHGQALEIHYGLRLRIEESARAYDVLVDLNGLIAAGCDVTVAGRAVDIRVRASGNGTHASAISLVFADGIDTEHSSGEFSAGWLRLSLGKQRVLTFHDH